MSLQTIESKLNSLFSEYVQNGGTRHIIFWYDKDGQYESEINNINLLNAKLLILTRNNALKTKYIIEHEQPETSFLIYAAFPKPDDNQNHLADTFYYSKFFTTDRETAICSECGIPQNFLQFMKNYSSFWTEANETQFKSKIKVFGTNEYNEKLIGLAMLASVLKIEVTNFSDVLKYIITEDYLDNEQKKYKLLEKSGISDLFWQYCLEEYGYNASVKEFDKLIASLFITHASAQIQDKFGTAYEPYTLNKVPNVVLFISNLMNDINSTDYYTHLASKVENGFKISKLVSGIEVDKCFDCYTFDVIDSKIAMYLIESILQTNSSLDIQLMSLISLRIKKTHFKSKYENLYRAINRASKLFSAIKDFEQEANSASSVDATSVVNNYISKWNKIDRYYRQFYHSFDNLSEAFNGDEKLESLRKLVENTYANKYLSGLSKLWTNKLEAIEDYSKLPGRKQWQFYDRTARYSARSERTVVIISDALRYECGDQLAKEMQRMAGNSVDLDYMISTVPSYTQLGMAALLPAGNFDIDDKSYVSINGKSTVGLDKRLSLLIENYGEKIAAYQFDDIIKKLRKDIRAELSGKELIYVYHNQVDARGDKAQSENEVFEACQEAIDEIKKLINKLGNDCSINKYIVTADHGFIYKRDKLESSDKVSTGHLHESDYKNKRFILTKNNSKIDSSLTFNMSYLSPNMGNTNVIVPNGADIFAMPGGGQNFVHGGVSLQEIVIPLITVETSRGKQIEMLVNVDIASTFRRISSLTTHIDFIQKEAVTDTMRPRAIKIWFEDENHQKVSNESIIVADRTSENAEDRIYKEKFIFGSRKYSPKDKYKLCIVDEATDLPITSYDFVIDIPFADDFGF